MLLEDSPSEGKGNGSRGEDAEPVPQMVVQKAEPDVEGERAVEVEEGEREREEPRAYDVELPHGEAKGGETEGEKTEGRVVFGKINHRF